MLVPARLAAEALDVSNVAANALRLRIAGAVE